MVETLDTIQKIGEWCKQHFFENKVLLVEDHRQATQLQELITKKGYNYINLMNKTIQEIAQESVRPLVYKQSQTLASDNQGIYIMEKVLKKLQNGNQLGYFQQVQINRKLAELFYQLIIELELEQVNAFPPEMLAGNKKLESIQIIRSNYNEAMVKRKYIDKGKMYRLALQQIGHDNLRNRYCLDVIHTELTKSERELKDSYVKNQSLLYSREKGKSSLEHLGDKEISYYAAYGEMCELYEIIRVIKKQNIPFEQVIIYHTDTNTYPQVMLELSESLNLPVTFGDGISIGNTKEAKLLEGIIEWIISDYRVEHLCSLLEYVDFTKFNSELENYELTSSAIKYALNRLNIGWGRDRYLEQLHQEKIRLESTLASAEDIQLIEHIQKWLGTWFELLPDGDITCDQLASGLGYIVNNHSRYREKKDGREAIRNILSEFEMIYDQCDRNKMLVELREMIQGQRVDCGSPEAGKIHLIHYQKGYWTDRQYHFIVGLEDKKFPKAIKQNALLLDEERMQLNQHGYQLQLAKEAPSQEIEAMIDLLNSREGIVTVSYPAKDVATNKENSPSYLLLNVVRQVEQQPHMDYDQFRSILGAPKGYIPLKREDSLTTEEKWLYEVNNVGRDITIEDVKASHSFTNQVQLAYQGRNSDQFTQYEGHVNIDSWGSITDEQKSISVTHLQAFAKCPYQYFLKYILKVTNNEVEMDEENWLNKLDYGNILHKIFEVFYKERKESLEAIGEKDNEVIQGIAEVIIEEYATSNRPLNEYAYVKQVAEIKEVIQVFLAKELEQAEKSVVEVELKFGMDREKEQSETNRGVRIALDNERAIYLSGVIDRINQLADNVYEIIDYKTGSAKPYKVNSMHKGEHLQNLLYALVMEELWGIHGQIKEASYYFTSLKGEFKNVPIAITDENKNKGLQIIRDIVNLIDQGVFIKNCMNKNEPCSRCDYHKICAKERDVEKQRNKWEKLDYKWEAGEELKFYEQKTSR